MMRAYAQNGEDVLLSRCFAGEASGFYVDIGANAPVLDSVTFSFYERGWRGVNVEPLPWRFEELARYRPRDVNLQLVCAEAPGRSSFYAAPGLDGLSSLVREYAVAAVGETGLIEFEVEATTLGALFEAYAPAAINFLKVDVEGAECAVLAGNDWTRWRPWVLVVEATKPRSTERTSAEWRPLLTAAGYRFAYFDGLNDFYVSEERSELLRHFETPVGVLDNYARFASYGGVFDDQRHPDYAWARNLAQRMLAAGGRLGADVDFVALTVDLPLSVLERPPTEADIHEAYARALSRPPAAADLARPEPTLRDLYRTLVLSPEFLCRRARAVISL
jgi:FkbM family methyltransferase